MVNLKFEFVNDIKFDVGYMLNKPAYGTLPRELVNLLFINKGLWSLP